MNVVMTQAAIADLLDIGHWIGLEDPDRALTFVDELEAKCLDLADKPFFIHWLRKSDPTFANGGIGNI